MRQTPIELEGQPAKPAVPSPTGFILQGWQKGLLLVVALGFLYMRIISRKRKHERICHDDGGTSETRRDGPDGEAAWRFETQPCIGPGSR